jgi:hypothetical protein
MPLPTARYRAIRTHYTGPTDTRGSRMIGDAGDRQSRVVLDYDDALNSEQNHATAAMAVVKKMGWDSEYHTPIVGGQYGNGDYYWAFTDTTAETPCVVCGVPSDTEHVACMRILRDLRIRLLS